MSKASTDYLLAGQAPELERLQLQSIVWEPAARELLTKLSPGTRSSAADLGCGAMGWLRVLSTWVGDGGHVTGTDVDERMLAGAQDFVEREQLRNVALVRDDLFNSQLPPRTFDLVHSRFQIAPLGRAEEQLAAYIRLLKPGGLLVIEDPDLASWRINPSGPAVQTLIALIERGFESVGGNFNSGRELPSIVRKAGIEPRVLANVVALEPGHPYLRLPLQFAASLRPRLEAFMSVAELNRLLDHAEAELTHPEAWGTTFTLIQIYATVP
jgi:SAM-dependent methyltransferase